MNGVTLNKIQQSTINNQHQLSCDCPPLSSPSPHDSSQLLPKTLRTTEHHSRFIAGSPKHHRPRGFRYPEITPHHVDPHKIQPAKNNQSKENITINKKKQNKQYKTWIEKQNNQYTIWMGMNCKNKQQL